MAARGADRPGRRSVAAWAGRILAAALGGYLGYLSIEGSRRLVRPSRRALIDGEPVTPTDIGLEYEDVRFATSDGVTLHGWLMPAGRETRSAVILMHGFAGNRVPDLVEIVPWLQRRYHVLQFDFRGHGQSGDAPISLASLARRDVPAAVGFVQSRGLGPLALMGISLGASVGIMAAGDLPVTAVVADAAFADLHDPVGNRMRLDGYPLATLGSRIIVAAATLRARAPRIYPLREVGRIAPRGLLIIAPRDDRLIGHRQSLKLYAAARDPKELYVVEGADHALAHAVGGAEYERRVLGFLARHLDTLDVADAHARGSGSAAPSFYNAAAAHPRSAPALSEDA